MASNAFKGYLIPLLKDAEELDKAHRNLRTGLAGRQWGLGALNRAVVVMCVSAWEAYLEEIVQEAVDVLRPGTPVVTEWQSLKARVSSAIGRFNNPNVENTRRLIADSLGLADVTGNWTWQNCTSEHACDKLNQVMKYRHEVAHGVNPRPTITNPYSKALPKFFRQLARRTDAAIKSYLVTALSVPSSWS